MKAVLDTNVWLDWLVFGDPSSDALARAVKAGTVELLASVATRAEWIDVIKRPKFMLDEARRIAIAARYDRHARIVAAADAPATAAGHPAALAPSHAPAPAPDRSPTLAPRTAARIAVPSLICRDPDDQKFLDLALLVDASFLVTRDRALLDLRRPALRRYSLLIVRPDAPSWCSALPSLL